MWSWPLRHRTQASLPAVLVPVYELKTWPQSATKDSTCGVDPSGTEHRPVFQPSWFQCTKWRPGCSLEQKIQHVELTPQVQNTGQSSSRPGSSVWTKDLAAVWNKRFNMWSWPLRHRTQASLPAVLVPVYELKTWPQSGTKDSKCGVDPSGTEHRPVFQPSWFQCTKWRPGRSLEQKIQHVELTPQAQNTGQSSSRPSSSVRNEDLAAVWNKRFNMWSWPLRHRTQASLPAVLVPVYELKTWPQSATKDSTCRVYPSGTEHRPVFQPSWFQCMNWRHGRSLEQKIQHVELTPQAQNTGQSSSRPGSSVWTEDLAAVWNNRFNMWSLLKLMFPLRLPDDTSSTFSIYHSFWWVLFRVFKYKCNYWVKAQRGHLPWAASGWATWSKYVIFGWSLHAAS